MNTVVPVLIVVILGAVVGMVIQRFSSSLWIGASVAAALATLLWIAGVYVFLRLTAPNELGPVLPRALLIVFAVAFFPALAVGWLARRAARREAGKC
jgi:hypothetical protein